MLIDICHVSGFLILPPSKSQLLTESFQVLLAILRLLPLEYGLSLPQLLHTMINCHPRACIARGIHTLQDRAMQILVSFRSMSDHDVYIGVEALRAIRKQLLPHIESQG